MVIRLASLLLATAGALVGSPAAAQFAKTEDAISYRQSAMFIQNQHFGRIAAMANGRLPFDASSAAANADIVAGISKLPWPAFGAGTEGGKARPEIWKEQAKFKELSEKLQAETDKLQTVAKGGNLEAIKAQVGAVGQTCKACHDDFRKK